MTLTSNSALKKDTEINKLTRGQSDNSSTDVLPENLSLLYLLIEISVPDNLNRNVSL